MRSSWMTVWCEVALAVGGRSACDRATVGAVIVRDNRVVATGYNGPATGYPAATNVGCQQWCSRAAGDQGSALQGYGYSCPSIHAEANALLHASRSSAENGTLYVTHSPCPDCAKLISNSGISTVVMMRSSEPHRPDPVPYLTSCGLGVVVATKTEEGLWVPNFVYDRVSE